VERALGDKPAEAMTLNTTGFIHLRLGALTTQAPPSDSGIRDALESFHQALTVERAAGDRANEAVRLSLAFAARRDRAGPPEQRRKFRTGVCRRSILRA